MKDKVKIIIEYDLVSSAISVVAATIAAIFTGEYNPLLFFAFVFPLSFVFFRYDIHRRYLTKWFYTHFEWRFRID